MRKMTQSDQDIRKSSLWGMSRKNGLERLDWWQEAQFEDIHSAVIKMRDDESSNEETGRQMKSLGGNRVWAK